VTQAYGRPITNRQRFLTLSRFQPGRRVKLKRSKLSITSDDSFLRPTVTTAVVCQSSLLAVCFNFQEINNVRNIYCQSTVDRSSLVQSQFIIIFGDINISFIANVTVY